MRVLVADGRAEVRSALRLLLQEKLFRSDVREVTQGAALLEAVRTTHPNLLLLDWALMHGSAGPTMVGLRHLAPHLPIIVLSAEPEVRQAALDAGAWAFVEKGEPPEQLLATMVPLVSRWEQEEEEGREGGSGRRIAAGRDFVPGFKGGGVA
jgi:DNA-binding response OmpR family regulator